MDELIEWYKKPFQKFLEFEGRARRKEFWTFTLGNILISLILSSSGGLIGFGLELLGFLFGLIIIIPSIAVAVRRLHDTGRSGFWILIGLIPIIGGLILLFFYLIDSEPGANQYGPNPKGAVV